MEEDQINLDIIDTDGTVDHYLLESMKYRLNKFGKSNEADSFTIFRVPYTFCQSNKKLFEPSSISIGPFHRGYKLFRSMEEQKWRFLQDFLSREDHISLNYCLREMKLLEEKTRRCYSEQQGDLHGDMFLEMMLLDGCFVLQYFLKWYEHRSNSVGPSVFLLLDLLLIENQIPFFIVEKLFEIGINRGDRMDFINYLVKIFARAGPALHEPIVPILPAEIHHLLHLCYHSLIPINPSKPVVLNSESFFPSMLSRIKNLVLDFPLWVLTRIFPKRNSLSLSFPNSIWKSLLMIPCATELQYAGIKLIPKSNPYHMFDISFRNGVLEIPRLTITNEIRTLLVNLIAFEQYKLDEMGANLSSFALFLDSLVNTPKDVMLLQKCGIINNCLASEDELTNFFNQICEGMVVENDHFMTELFKEVNKYCESSWGRRRARWNRHKTEFIRTYFSSPWTAISVVAAGVVVLLTCVQSFFAIYAYYVPPSS